MRQLLLASLASLLLTVAAGREVFGSPLTFLRGRAQEEAAEEQQVIDESETERDVVVVPPAVVPQFRTVVGSKNRLQGGGREWVQMPRSPPGAVSAPIRSRIELECEAIGSPAPQIYWLKGEAPLRQVDELVGNSVSNDEGASPSWRGIARTRSKLTIECVSPRNQEVVHCAAISGTKTVLSKPTMILVNELEKGNGSSCGAESRPRVTLYSPIMMAPIGSTAVLPCRASGRPRPRIIWLDNNEIPVMSSPNSRYKVLASGELMIYPLEWDDMGGFTCIARSDRDEDAVTTFLYPMLPTEKESDDDVHNNEDEFN